MMKIKNLLLYGFFLGIGISCGLLINNGNDQMYKDAYFNQKYPHINPLKFCEIDENNSGNKKLNYLKKEIEKNINKSGMRVGVYYKELKNGNWFAINQNELFRGQSLFKLPIAMGYYKAAESSPNLLKNEITYKGEYESLRNNDRDESIQPNTKYTIEQLIEHSLIYSDNQAKELLFYYTSVIGLNPVIDDIYNQLKIEPTKNFVNVTEYSEALRILYNSTYLNEKNSEKILSLLINAYYKGGLVAGFPPEIEIAHKFGVRNIADEEFKELHDCGIVYLPEKDDRLICIMTEGKDLVNQEKLINQLGSIFAEELLPEDYNN